jgi:ribosomal protein S18 acetylase RimI-like enzyme
MTKNVTIRKAQEIDRDFIFSLSPRLAEVAGLPWHSEEIINKMQNEYISDMLDNAPEPRTTLIAEKNEEPLGFIHACTHKDSISDESCGTITLLAVSTEAKNMGIGKLLMMSAEDWAKKQGYRLLHLEVFANNHNAQHFYQHLGFKAEMLHMIKPLEP